MPAHRPIRSLSAGCLILVALVGRPAGAQPIVPTAGLPLTVAEQSDFTRTTTHAQVWEWLEMLAARSPDLTVTSIGLSTEGRRMPLVVASRPLVTDPAAARSSGKPILYLQGNIHAGEVEGKDALLMLLRDVTLGEARGLLDRVILLVSPIYNADGNEMWGPVARNRRGQDGPEEVGLRYNGMGLDLNRDYIKTEAPETRRALESVVLPWQPDLFMDLHTTNGSYHGYDLTYAPSNTPTAPQGPVVWTKEVLLPHLRARLAEHGHPIFDYGNFGRGGTPPDSWHTFGWEPRYASNYMGMHGMVSILSEAVSYRPFRTRLSATYWLLREAVTYAGTHADELLEQTRRAGEEFTRWAADPSGAPAQGVRYEERSRGRETVVYEMIETPAGGQGRGTRTGRLEEALMDVYTEYAPTLERPFPAGYLVPVSFPEAIEQMLRHGVRIERLDGPWEGQALVFRVDTLSVATRPYQGHRQVDLEGTWRTETLSAPVGWYWVPAGQRLGGLVFTLLEPESPDGLAAWNFFDRSLSERRDAPVLKLMALPAVARTPVTGPVYR